MEILTDGPIFNEFAIRLSRPVKQVNQALFQHGIIGGLALERFYPEAKNQMLVCATEVKTKDQLDQFAQTLKEVLK